MTILCSLLAAAVILLVGVGLWREKIHRAVVGDLLDRVMARSYGEYVAATKPLERPVRRRIPTDEEMALLEERSKVNA